MSIQEKESETLTEASEKAWEMLMRQEEEERANQSSSGSATRKAENTATTAKDSKEKSETYKAIESFCQAYSDSKKEKYLKIDHLDNAAYKKQCDDLLSFKDYPIPYSADERKQRDALIAANNEKAEAIEKKLLDDYKKSLHHFTNKQDEDVNVAVSHLRRFKAVMDSDEGVLYNYTNLASEFFKKTGISISDFKKRVGTIIEAFDNSVGVISGVGLRGTSDYSQTAYICNTDDLLKSRKYVVCKNGFAHLSHYDSILKNEKIYYEVFYSQGAVSVKDQANYSRNMPDKISVKKASIVAAILAFIGMAYAQPLLEYQWYLCFVIIAVAGLVAIGLPLLLNKMARAATLSEFKRNQSAFASTRSCESDKLIGKIPTDKNNILYVAQAGRAIHKIMCLLEEFLKLNCNYCSRIPYDIKDNNRYLSALRPYLQRSRGFSDAIIKHREDCARNKALEKERLQREKEEKFKRDVIDAIERGNNERNTIIALAALDAQKTSKKMIQLEEERMEMLKKAIDDLEKS